MVDGRGTAVVAQRMVVDDVDDAEVEISETRDVPITALRALQDTAAWAKGRSSAQLRTLLCQTDIFLTAWQGEVLVGCARVLTDFAVRALICDVIVSPDHQGKGIGRMLLETIEAHPALREVETLCLFTSQKHDFYAHLGWEDHTGTGMALRRWDLISRRQTRAAGEVEPALAGV